MSKAEKFIEDYTRNCSNEFEPQKAPPSVYNPWITPEDERRAVEIAKEEVIEKVCEFLDNDLCCYIKAQDFSIEHGRLNDDLKKHLDNSFIKNP